MSGVTPVCHHVHVSQICWTRDRGSLVYCMKLSLWRMGKPLVGVWVVEAPLNELRPQVTGSWSRHWHRSQVTCYWRQIGEHSVLPATGGRLENTPFYLPLEADWRTLRSTCNQQKKRQQYLHIWPVIPKTLHLSPSGPALIFWRQKLHETSMITPSMWT